MATEREFDQFIDTLPASIRNAVQASALYNAGDTLIEDPAADYWTVAIATARMIADDPASFDIEPAAI